MRIEGKIEVSVRRQALWDFLLDLERFSSCLPGIESASQLNADTFTGVLTTKLGPMSGSFNFRATIVEREPPRAMKVRTEGKDSVTGSPVRTDVDLRLEETAGARSTMAYCADVEVSGPLAIIGDMVIRGTATFLMAEFGRRLRSRLEGESAGASASARG